MKLCFATNSSHKLQEVRDLLRHHFEILSLNDIHCKEELPETHDTLEENALEKAAYVHDKFHIACFADDTGLEVDVLNGQPGVYSARYAGPERNGEKNMDLLLHNLRHETNRNARFRTVIALFGLQKNPVTFEGVVSGKIARERRGTAGFGYDPVFIPDGFTKSFAEMTLPEKNGISHRAQAVGKLVHFLRTLKHTNK